MLPEILALCRISVTHPTVPGPSGSSFWGWRQCLLESLSNFVCSSCSRFLLELSPESSWQVSVSGWMLPQSAREDTAPSSPFTHSLRSDEAASAAHLRVFLLTFKTPSCP